MHNFGGKDGIWKEEDYINAMDRVKEWMQGDSRCNVVFLETPSSFVKMLWDLKELYAFHGSWTFSEEIGSIENILKFEGQRIKVFPCVANIVVMLVCPTYTNSDVNIPRTMDAELPLLFQDCTSK